jgi:hypothetical protein
MFPPVSNFHRLTRKTLGQVIDSFLYIDYFLSRYTWHSKNKRESINFLGKPRVVIFSVFLNSEAEYLVIQEYAEECLLEFDQILLINTGDYKLLNSPDPRLTTIQRKNYGRDFGSLNYIFQTYGHSFSDISELLIINDSVIWKKGALLTFIMKSRLVEAHVTSLTSSYQHSYHLQSYALHFKKIDARVLDVLGNISSFYFKRTIVKYGEKRLTESLKQIGISISSLFDAYKMQSNVNNYKEYYDRDFDSIQCLTLMGIPLNPTIHFWPELALSAGLIKKSLFKNPANFEIHPKSNLKLLGLIREWESQRLKIQ